MAQWSNVAAHVAAELPELCEALDRLHPDTATDSLPICGKPGEKCWGADGARDAIFCSLSDRDVEALVSALQVQGILPGLKGLELRSHVGLTDAGARALARLLEDSEGALEALDLYGCEIEGPGTQALCDVVAKHTTLRTLRLDFNPLGREGGLAIAKMLEQNTSLETLSLGSTSLDTTTMVCLYAVLRNCKYLKNVNLQKAVLFSKHDDTAKHAAQMLCINNNLVSLNLANTFVGDLGAQTIAQALDRNSTCKRLCLANNRFGEAGARAFAALFRSKKCAIATLDLSHNGIGEVGGASLGDALAGCTALRKLDLSFCGLGEEALRRVAAGMNLNSALHSLRLWGNDFSGALSGSSGDDGPPPMPSVRLSLQPMEANDMNAKAPSIRDSDGSIAPSSAVAELDLLLRGRFLHLDVECDLDVYEVDGALQVAIRHVLPLF